MRKREKNGGTCGEKSVLRTNHGSLKADSLKDKLLALVFTFFMLLVSAVAVGGELLVNGNFKDVENGRPRGWRIHGDTAAVCGETAGEGKTALRLSVAPGRFVTAASPPVKVEPGVLYRIRWRCRTADFAGAKAYVFLEIGKRQQTLPSPTAADAEKRRMLTMRGNGDWTEFETGYRPAEGENEFRVVLTTHDEKDTDTAKAAAWFADVSVARQETIETKEDEMKIKLSLGEGRGVKSRAGRFYLDLETYVQSETENHVLMDTRHGQSSFLQGGGAKTDEAGVRYVDYAGNLEYTFWINSPGKYHRWLQAWRPARGHYCHHESVNNSDPGDLIAHYKDKIGEWEWVRGPVYEFPEAGYYSFRIHGLYAGARLSKILFAADENFNPENASLPETARRCPPRGELHSESLGLEQVSEWLDVALPMFPTRAPVEIFWRIGTDGSYRKYDGDTARQITAAAKPGASVKFKVVVSPTGEDVALGRLANISIGDSLAARFKIDPGQTVRLENDKQLILLSRINGALRGIFNKAGGQWTYHPGVYSSPFSLVLYCPDSKTERAINAEQFELEKSDIRSDKAEFVYRSEADNITVATAYAIGDNELSDWKITVENNGRIPVIETVFPNFSSLRVGDNGTDNVMIFPRGWTKRFRIGDSGDKRYFPGSMAMGWLDIYDEKTGAGQFVAINDPELLLTQMSLDSAPGNQGMSAAFSKSHGIMSGERQTWSYTVGIHMGGWHWAADQYRQLTAGWIRDFDAPEWLRESNGMAMHAGQFGGPHEFTTFPRRYMETRYFGLDALWVWGPQSSHRGPCGDGFYFPSPVFGSEQDLIDANSAVHALGGRIGFYQWTNWNVNYETSQTVAWGTVEKSALPDDVFIPRAGYARDNQLMHKDGSTYYFPIYIPKSGAGPVRYNHNPPDNPEDYVEYRPTLMYPTEEHNEYLKYYSRRWAEKYHADGFYMDEGIMKARPCFNPVLGHVGDGRTGRGMIDSLRQMWETGRKHNPDFVLNSEGMNCAAGQYAAHFVGVFEPDADIVKYTFPRQIYLDGNLAGHRTKAPFEAVRDVFLLGNHLMMSRSGHWFDNEDALAAINLRRNLRGFFAYATYRDKVGISVDDKSIDCRVFHLDFQGNSGIMLAISNPGKLAGKTVGIDGKYPVSAGSRGFAIALDGSVTPVQAMAGDGEISVPVPASKLSGVVLLDQVAPAWRLLPVITRKKGAGIKPFAWFADVSVTRQTTTGQGGGELLDNGRFKHVDGGRPQGWRIHGDTATVCGEVAWKDSKALRLSVAPGRFVTSHSPPVKVEPGEQYRIRWRCRTADFTGARAYAFLQIGNRQQSLADVSMRGNGDWTEFETGYRPAEGENEFRLVLTTHDESVSWHSGEAVTYKIDMINFGDKTAQGTFAVAPEGGTAVTGEFTIPPHDHVPVEATVSSATRHFGFIRCDLAIKAPGFTASETDFVRFSK